MSLEKTLDEVRIQPQITEGTSRRMWEFGPEEKERLIKTHSRQVTVVSDWDIHEGGHQEQGDYTQANRRRWAKSLGEERAKVLREEFEEANPQKATEKDVDYGIRILEYELDKIKQGPLQYDPKLPPVWVLAHLINEHPNFESFKIRKERGQVTNTVGQDRLGKFYIIHDFEPGTQYNSYLIGLDGVIETSSETSTRNPWSLKLEYLSEEVPKEGGSLKEMVNRFPSFFEGLFLMNQDGISNMLGRLKNCAFYAPRDPEQIYAVKFNSSKKFASVDFTNVHLDFPSFFVGYKS